MNIANRIKNLRGALGLTQLQLADLVGSTQQTIQKIEDGTTKNPRNIESLASSLESTPEYLRFGINQVNDPTLTPSMNRAIPLISFTQAGHTTSINEVRETQTAYSINLVCPVASSDQTFALRVQGISMEPKFTNGDLIFLDPQATCNNGSYVVAKLNNEKQATFKQLIIEGELKFLKAINPSWPDQLTPINDNCIIVGKVIFSGREY